MSDSPGIDLIHSVSIRQANKSKGFRTRRGYLATFTAGPGVKSSHDVSFPYAVDLMNGDYWLPSTAHQENKLWVEIHPNLNLAALVSGAATSGAVASGDTYVTLNAQGAGALAALLASDGVTQCNEVYFRLTSIPGDPLDYTDLRMANWDAANSRLVSPSGGAFGLTASSGAAVYVTSRWEDGTYLAPGEYVKIGDETVGSSSLPANIPIRFVIQNEAATELKIGFNLAYLHS